ncbi:MAG: DPP IV N-terminal domain-containing protein [Pedobacter sp.]|nr:DPP IV N-terminal domain-containing protein [Pedobacter sp.]
MKKSLVFFMLSACVIATNAQTKASLSVKDYQHAESFLSYNTNQLVYHGNINANWLPDGRFWYTVNTANGASYVLIDPEKNTRIEKDSKAALGDLPDSKTPQRKVRGSNEVTSPDGKKVVFIKDFNLYVRDLETSKETQLTFDGLKNYGYATDNAGWKRSDAPIVRWSPNSKKVATFQQDQRKVSDMYMVSINVGAPKLTAWKYPLPGDSVIATIRRVIIDVDQPKVVSLQIAPDPHRATLSDDVSSSGTFDDIDWKPDGTEMAFVSTSRDHKDEKFRIANAETGAVREVFEEKMKTQYESGQGAINWRYLPASKEIIWYSERDNWGHLYLYDSSTGKLKNQITKGDYVVTKLMKVDEKKRLLFFEVDGLDPKNPYFTHFCSIKFDGKSFKDLTPQSGAHQIDLSPSADYFVDTYSTPSTAPVSVLRNNNGKLIFTLETADLTALKATGWKPPIEVTAKAHDGKTDIYGLVFTPTEMVEGKKYPVIDYIYPGPQGGSVGSWSFASARGDNQALAELGFVVVVMEGTSNPNRSKSFHDMSYGNMAENTLPDQITSIRQLSLKFPIDTNKVGIWGHSGGGFATAAAMFRYPDFFKVGIAESGNHENRNYEDDWGERYNGLVQNADYEAQANQKYAKNLKGKLLLAHGMMDDNVPLSNTMLVVDALIKANKTFDLVLFPQAAHGYGTDSYYMMRRRWDYFVVNLLEREPPVNYKMKYTTVK